MLMLIGTAAIYLAKNLVLLQLELIAEFQIQNSILGSIIFSGDDGDEFVKGAMIQGAVDAGVTTGNNDMAGRLMFLTTADGAQEPTERLRITSFGNLKLPDSAEIQLGNDTQYATGDLRLFHNGSNSGIIN